jgi:hypothetical protein
MQPNEPVIKDDSRQRPIPTAWRQAFRDVVSAFVEGDYRLARGAPGVEPIAPETALQIGDCIRSYGATLTELPEESWETSVCIWTGSRWDVLVDLWTQEEGRSDLVLHAHVIDEGRGYKIMIHLVYVP